MVGYWVNGNSIVCSIGPRTYGNHCFMSRHSFFPQSSHTLVILSDPLKPLPTSISLLHVISRLSSCVVFYHSPTPPSNLSVPLPHPLLTLFLTLFPPPPAVSIFLHHLRVCSSPFTMLKYSLSSFWLTDMAMFVPM